MDSSLPASLVLVAHLAAIGVAAPSTEPTPPPKLPLSVVRKTISELSTAYGFAFRKGVQIPLPGGDRLAVPLLDPRLKLGLFYDVEKTGALAALSDRATKAGYRLIWLPAFTAEWALRTALIEQLHAAFPVKCSAADLLRTKPIRGYVKVDPVATLWERKAVGPLVEYLRTRALAGVRPDHRQSSVLGALASLRAQEAEPVLLEMFLDRGSNDPHLSHALIAIGGERTKRRLLEQLSTDWTKEKIASRASRSLLLLARMGHPQARKTGFELLTLAGDRYSLRHHRDLAVRVLGKFRDDEARDRLLPMVTKRTLAGGNPYTLLGELIYYEFDQLPGIFPAIVDKSITRGAFSLDSRISLMAAVCLAKTGDRSVEEWLEKALTWKWNISNKRLAAYGLVRLGNPKGLPALEAHEAQVKRRRRSTRAYLILPDRRRDLLLGYKDYLQQTPDPER